MIVFMTFRKYATTYHIVNEETKPYCTKYPILRVGDSPINMNNEYAGRAGEADATEEVSVCTVIKRNWAMLITMWWTFVVMFFGIIQIGFHKTSWACFQYDAVDHKGDPRLNKDGTQKIDYTVHFFRILFNIVAL